MALLRHSSEVQQVLTQIDECANEGGWFEQKQGIKARTFQTIGYLPKEE